MKIFIIGAVRDATANWNDMLLDYVAQLEEKGHEVHLPMRDTDQKASGRAICRQNVNAIAAADEIHLFYDPKSQGTHFDMGAAFALGKKLKVIKNIEYGEGKSYARMADEWADSQ